MIVTAGIFAAALFYGDALITPAISVLSAVEGLSVAAPAMRSSHHSDQRRRAYRTVFHPASRYGKHGQAVRPDHAAVVRVPGHSRIISIAQNPVGVACPRSDVRDPFHAGTSDRYVHVAVRRVPGTHRRGGAICRYGTLWSPNRCGWHGTGWSAQHCLSTISDRALWSCVRRLPSRIRSTCSRRTGSCCRWSHWPPRPP